MHVKVTARLAGVMEGVELSGYREGDVIELPDRDAKLLVDAGWVDPAPVQQPPRPVSGRRVFAPDPTS